MEAAEDHSSPEVIRKVARIQIYGAKKGFVGAVFCNLRPNQLIYLFEIFLYTLQTSAHYIFQYQLCEIKALGVVERPKPKMPAILYIYRLPILWIRSAIDVIY